MQKIGCFLIGAQKAGTTTLYSWLSQHPKINAPESLKDFHFFTSAEYYSKGTAWLESLYGKKDDRVRLHCAVNYIFREDAAQRIAKYNQNAKMIAVLRDPVARAFSAYRFFRKLGREKRSFERAVEDESLGLLETQEKLDDFGYLSHGFYARQLETWLRYFRMDQILVLVYEEIFSKPERCLREVFSFLRLEDPPYMSLRVKNVSGEARRPMLNRLIYDREGIFRRFVKATKTNYLIPLKWRIWLLGRFRDWNTKSGNCAERLSPETYLRLSRIFEEDNYELERLLNRNLELWNVKSDPSAKG